MIIAYFNEKQTYFGKVVRTFNSVEYVNIPALCLIFLQVVEKVSMFDMKLRSIKRAFLSCNNIRSVQYLTS